MTKFLHIFTLFMLSILFFLAVPAQTSSINSLSAQVVSFKFYERPYEWIPYGEREYNDIFQKQDTRFISYEMTLDYPAPGRVVDVNFTGKFFYPDGTLLGISERTSSIQPEWSLSVHTGALGWREPGYWQTGTYTVQVFDESQLIAEGQFTITDGTQTDSSDRQKAERLFNWIESLVPELFIPAQPSIEEVDAIIYRYYATSQTFLATFQGHLFFLFINDELEWEIIDLGEVDFWINYIGLEEIDNLEQTILSIGDALISGNPDQFGPWFSRNLSMPAERPTIPQDIAEKLGQAIKNATLIKLTTYYAFYEMTIDDKTYPLTMLQEEEGQWKIDQF